MGGSAVIDAPFTLPVAATSALFVSEFDVSCSESGAGGEPGSERSDWSSDHLACVFAKVEVPASIAFGALLDDATGGV
jgi:hypothetical protein